MSSVSENDLRAVRQCRAPSRLLSLNPWEDSWILKQHKQLSIEVGRSAQVDRRLGIGRVP